MSRLLKSCELPDVLMVSEVFVVGSGVDVGDVESQHQRQFVIGGGE